LSDTAVSVVVDAAADTVGAAAGCSVAVVGCTAAAATKQLS